VIEIGELNPIDTGRVAGKIEIVPLKSIFVVSFIPRRLTIRTASTSYSNFPRAAVSENKIKSPSRSSAIFRTQNATRTYLKKLHSGVSIWKKDPFFSGGTPRGRFEKFGIIRDANQEPRGFPYRPIAVFQPTTV